MIFHVLTLFPEMIASAAGESITGRAEKNGLLTVDCVNIRDFTTEKHGKVDDYPYGGGAGMVMQAQPIYDAWKHVSGGNREIRTVYMSPKGRTFDQALAHSLAAEQEIILLCGHYEGVDERVLDEIVTDQISIGDYVLTGGELAALVVIDAVSRLVPGVLHNEESPDTESFEHALLEYPQYSRPEVWNGHAVPPILLSGDHAKVDAWRHEQALLVTADKRPDLLRGAALDDRDRVFLRSRGYEIPVD